MFSEFKLFERIRHITKNLYKSFINFLYPPFCYTCDKRLMDEEKLICETCWKSFKSFEGGIKIDRKDLKLPSGKNFTECHTIYYYNDKTLKLIHVFKYYKKSSLSIRIGKDFGDVIRKNNFEKKYDMIIPVPLHKSRERERGFNQSNLICKQAASISGLPLLNDVIIRKKNSKSQSQLAYKERIENVKNIFNIKSPRKIKGRKIILIDDIITTGLTVNSCCSELKKHGAEEILCLAVIHPVSK